jgi:prepilin-type N-terminal cleavage/methylation domain-containing protein
MKQCSTSAVLHRGYAPRPAASVSVCQHRADRGYTLVELMLACLVILIVAAVAVPIVMTSIHTSKFRGAAADFAGLIQTARIYAIRDNRFYSTYILAPNNSRGQEAYVDMLPKGTTGASGNGGTAFVSGDPVAAMPTEVTPQAVGAAPATSNLQAQLLPSNTPVNPTDATVTPITFSPRGLPCLVTQVTGGSVCNALGGPAAYWMFFQDSYTKNWEAVTITPAGRVQRWYYTGTGWSEL